MRSVAAEQVQTATRSLAELRGVMQGIAAHPGVTGADVSLFARIFKRSTVAYRDRKFPQTGDEASKEGKTLVLPVGRLLLRRNTTVKQDAISSSVLSRWVRAP